MAAIDLTPEEQADRLIGRGILASTNGDVLRVADTNTDARELLDEQEHPEVIDLLNTARTVDGDSSEYRRYLERAREKLEVSE